MTKYETIKTLEKRYHCQIQRSTFYNPISGQEQESFIIYSLDGCCWDKVIGYRSLVRTLVEDKVPLRRLAGLEMLVRKEMMA